MAVTYVHSEKCNFPYRMHIFSFWAENSFKLSWGMMFWTDACKDNKVNRLNIELQNRNRKLLSLLVFSYYERKQVS